MKSSRTQRGFTMTELLIVVSIIVILAITILVAINPMAQIFKGYDSRRKADLQKIKIALENYYADHDCYPKFPMVDERNHPTYICGSDFLKPYLPSMPCDPNTQKPYTIFLSPGNSTCPQQFAVYAQIYAFFDKDASAIPYCPKTIAVGSPGLTVGQMSAGCSEVEICANYYGCKDGSCQWISAYDIPACTPHYCTQDCGQGSPSETAAYCSIPDNACL